MPPKKGKAAGRKGKQAKAEPVTKKDTEVTATNSTDGNEEGAAEGDKANDVTPLQSTATTDAQAGVQADVDVASQPEITDPPPEQADPKSDTKNDEALAEHEETTEPSPAQPEAQSEAEPETEPAAKTVELDKSKAGEELEAEKEEDEVLTESSKVDPTPETKPAKSNKRKAADAPVSNEEKKTSATARITDKPTKKPRKDPKLAREGERKSGRAARKTEATQDQILNYLLSDAAADLCRPDDEARDIQERGSDIKTYSTSVLSPFEELLCALVLSRPISHRLGLRTIRTILNDPYNFTTPKIISDAGKEKTRQALEDAHTQHKDKTAEQISLIAEVVASKFSDEEGDSSLEKVREEGNKDWDGERDLLQANVKGLGKTGLDIFFRRTQWLWEESFPFIDERTARGVEKLGLPKNADKLREVLEKNWFKLDTDEIAGDDKAAKIRRAFVIICERATGADLEEKSQSLLEAAASF